MRAHIHRLVGSVLFSAHRSLLILLLSVMAICPGCSRRTYRVEADEEAYSVISERNHDARWQIQDYSIDVNPRSRYFDPYDPDKPPMPQDDPASAQYMRQVYGKSGWRYWDANGNRLELENPDWNARLADYVTLTGDGAVKLDVETALKLAYVHSPNHQRQLETLYLSALDVTAERFRLDAQFFGGYDLLYNHDGSLIPASLGYDSASGRFIVNPPADVDGAETNRITLGRGSSGNPALQARRRFASAGELVAGFANSFVFEVTGKDANLAASLLNFSFIQPLLRGAGRDIALEQLTFDERNLLSNLRAYGQFRQGFYTLISIGELGVSGPQRGGRSTFVQSFSGQGFVGGYIGLLQQLQRLRNSQDNLDLQVRILSQLEALRAVGAIDLVQVDQFRQNVQFDRARLLQDQNSLELSMDRYKTNTLGLPPHLNVQLDDALIRQFQLVSAESTALQDLIVAQQDEVSKLPEKPTAAQVGEAIKPVFKLIPPVRQQLAAVANDIEYMEKAAPAREKGMAPDEVKQFRNDRAALKKTLGDLRTTFQKSIITLRTLLSDLTPKNAEDSGENLVVWLGDTLRLAQRLVLVQARARLEAVSIETVDLKSEEAFKIALDNRLDFMNARAALVDQWRLIQVNADALQSVLNVTASGDVRTARNKPFDFKAPTGNLRLGLEFDAPFTRLLERNAYRESLIQYQQSRRQFIQSRDSLHLGLRALIRNLAQLSANLETQRTSVAIAIRRVDLTRANLYAPVPPPQPGQRVAQFGPTAAINLLSSLSSLRDTQNAFLRVWLDYYATRMRLERELGTMSLDRDGRWLGAFRIQQASQQVPPPGQQPSDPELPPKTSARWERQPSISRLPPLSRQYE